jgi:hypothetical protein
MPQCEFPIFCRFVFQKSYTGNILEIGQNEDQNSYFFPDEGRGPKESRRGARGQPHHEGARPSPWPSQPVVRPPWSTPDDAPLPIKSLLMENPKTISEISRRVP